MAMTQAKAVSTIDFLLDVLNLADGDTTVETLKQTTIVDDSDEKESLFDGIDDDGIKVGNRVRITSHLDVLLSKFRESELDTNDASKEVLNAIGEIVEIREDDDTVKIKVSETKTIYVPVKACKSA